MSETKRKNFTGEFKAHGIAISMDGRGRALDNIFVERHRQQRQTRRRVSERLCHDVRVIY